MNAATQRRIALVGLAVFAVGMLFLVTHRRTPPPADAIKPPSLAALVAKRGDIVRPVTPADPLSVGDSLDFQIEVKDQCFAYVYSVQGNSTRLEWGADLNEPAWEAGVYAPNWVAPKSGLELVMPGSAAVYVLISPVPVADAAQWTESNLQDPHAGCSRCAVASAHFAVQAH